MILGEVEETITTVEIDDETYEEIIKVCRHTHTHTPRRSCAFTSYRTVPGAAPLPARAADVSALRCGGGEQTQKRNVQYLFVRGVSSLLYDFSVVPAR
jgi:hypothetical protein